MKRKEIIYEFFNKTDNYLNKNFGVIIRTKIIKDILGFKSNKDILDVGCGDGSITLDYGKNNNLFLIDQSKNMLDLAKINANKKDIKNINYNNLKFEKFIPKKNKYDIIIALGLLAHVESIHITFTKLISCLKNDGMIILQYSDYDKILTKINLYFSNKVYKKNKINQKLINLILKKNKLMISHKIRYSFLPPGIGLLSNEQLYSLTMETYQNKFLSKFGTEIICVIKNK